MSDRTPLRARWVVGLDAPGLNAYQRCWTRRGALCVKRKLAAAFPDGAIVVTRVDRRGRVRVQSG